MTRQKGRGGGVLPEIGRICMRKVTCEGSFSEEGSLVRLSGNPGRLDLQNLRTSLE